MEYKNMNTAYNQLVLKLKQDGKDKSYSVNSISEAFALIEDFAKIQLKKEQLDFLNKYHSFNRLEVTRELQSIDSFIREAESNRNTFEKGTGYTARLGLEPINLEQSIYLLLSDKVEMERYVQEIGLTIHPTCMEVQIYAKYFLFKKFLQQTDSGFKTLRSIYTGSDAEFETDLSILREVTPRLIDSSNVYVGGSRKKTGILAWYDTLNNKGKFKNINNKQLVGVLNNFFKGYQLGNEGRSFYNSQTTTYKRCATQVKKFLDNPPTQAPVYNRKRLLVGFNENISAYSM